MTLRRYFIAVAGSWLALPQARAQQAGRTYRLGWLGLAAPRAAPYNIAFVKRLGELGFVEGRNLVIEFRGSPGQIERLPQLAAELTQLNCDVYFAPGSELNLNAVKQATRDQPIVIVSNDYDPVAAGYVTNMARPGGRITGISQLQTELPAKRLALLKELLPKLRRVGVLADASTSGQLEVSRDAAVQLGLELVVHQFASFPYEYEAAFAGFTRGKAQALVALSSAFFVPARKQIPELALAHRLPSIFNNTLWAESGGLMSYGPNFSASYRRAAEQVAQILKGANPGDMPIEQPNVIEMVLNLVTAKALGLTVPQALRLRADEVIR
ncbi:MAG: ABC transporter substrate-binding protein [Burkholderiaceae bacterium]